LSSLMMEILSEVVRL